MSSADLALYTLRLVNDIGSVDEIPLILDLPLRHPRFKTRLSEALNKHRKFALYLDNRSKSRLHGTILDPQMVEVADIGIKITHDEYFGPAIKALKIKKRRAS
jgi:hypothetical protein